MDQVLLVDDDASLLESAASVFAQHGVRVEPANSGQTAIEMVKMSSHRAAILDIFMPGKQGLDVAMEIKALDPDIALLFLTGQVVEMPALQKRARSLGLGDALWLSKPFPVRSEDQVKFFANIRSNIIQQRFHNLFERWKKETRFVSSTTEKGTHLAYQQIIGMGPVIVPLIISELRKGTDHWFWALKAITGQDPVPAEERGDLNLMRERWLGWARERSL